MKAIDNLDQRLLNELMKDTRQSLRELALKLKVSFVTVKNRIKALEEAGIITQFNAKIDFEKLGLETHVMIEMRIAKGKLLELEKKVAKNPSIYAVYDVTGEFDAVLFGRFKSMRMMDSFLKELQTYEFVERTMTKLILNTIKNEQVRL